MSRNDFEDALFEPDEAKQCGQTREPHGFSLICTRTRGHGGAHVAHGLQPDGIIRVVGEWPRTPADTGRTEDR